MTDTAKKEQTYIYIMDRLVNKPVKLSAPKDTVCAPKDKVVYYNEEKKEMLGTVLGYQVRADKKGKYAYPLTGTQAEHFISYQEKAQELYEIFKKEFKAAFPESVPVTARMNLQGNQVYFYFYAETRFNFAEFVKSFRPKIGYNFFLYQVGPRDRVRMHPHVDERYDPSGLPLMYHIFKHSLPNVHDDTLQLQQLGGRNNDRIKDRSGKFDHTINFEKEFYEKESKKYPSKGSIIQREGNPMKCMGYNLLTQEIKLRGRTHESTKHDKDKNKKTDKPKKRERKPERKMRLGEFKIVTLDAYLAQKKDTPVETKRSPRVGVARPRSAK